MRQEENRERPQNEVPKNALAGRSGMYCHMNDAIGQVVSTNNINKPQIQIIVTGN